LIPFETCDLTCSYDTRTVFEHLNLEVRAGEVLALIGPNGVGKSTLLRALARLLKPKYGKVLLAGRNLWQISSGEAARKLAFAGQSDGEGWPATVEQVIALGRSPHRGWLLPLNSQDRQVIERAIALTGLDDLRHRLVTELSGGEQQRVILARILAQEPKVLLLDEPTSHLDLKYQTSILGLLRQLARHEGITVVLSLHDLNLAALYADRLALLSEGQIAIVGTPVEVLTAENLARVYGVAVFVTHHPVTHTPMIMPELHEVKCYEC
jgi:iron complex transport system ATP-binding protein